MSLPISRRLWTGQGGGELEQRIASAARSFGSQGGSGQRPESPRARAPGLARALELAPLGGHPPAPPTGAGGASPPSPVLSRERPPLRGRRGGIRPPPTRQPLLASSPVSTQLWCTAQRNRRSGPPATSWGPLSVYAAGGSETLLAGCLGSVRPGLAEGRPGSSLVGLSSPAHSP